MDVRDKRPDFLNKLINAKKQLSADNTDIDKQFISLIETAVSDIKTGGVISVRLTDCSRSHQQIVENSSLRIIFNYYAKFQPPPGWGGLTFTERLVADETMCLFELTVFCRNFRVIPNLITKEELTFLWKSMNIQRVKLGLSVKKDLDYEDFKLFVVRIAVFAYTKPGMLTMIQAIGGLVPDHELMVESIANYLQLHTTDSVREVIDTWSRTAGAPNLKGKLAKTQIMDDVRARRLGQVLATGNTISRPNSAQNSRRGSKVGNDNRATSPPTSPLQDSLSPPKSLAPSASQELFQTQTLKIASAIHRRKTSIVDGENVLLSKAADLLAEISRENVYSDQQHTIYSEHKIENMRQQHERISLNRHDRSNLTLVQLADVPGVIVSQNQENAILNFDHNLSRYLDRFSKVVSGMGVSRSEHSTNLKRAGGPFLDLGKVKAGGKLKIQVHVHNTSDQEMEMDIVARNFCSDEVVVTTIPKSFAPGLMCNATVTVAVPRSSRPIIGLIDVLAVPTRNQPSTIISCPVFLRVLPGVAERPSSGIPPPVDHSKRRQSLGLPPTSSVDGGTLNMETLPMRSNKVLGVAGSTPTAPKAEMPPRVSFEKMMPSERKNDLIGNSTNTRRPMTAGPSKTDWAKSAQKNGNGKWQTTKAIMKAVDALGS